jgi:matrixin
LSRLQKTLFLLFVLTVVESLTPTSALAYATGGSPWPTDGPCPGGNCYGQPVTLRYSFGTMFDNVLKMPNEQPVPHWLIRGSIEEALRLWSQVVNVNFVEVPEGSPVQFKFSHVYINGPDLPPPADPWAKAQVTCVGYGSGCEVQYDEGDRWQEVGTTPLPDILGASIHEVGHILGLNHTDVNGANMYKVFHRFSGLGTGQLFQDDINGVRAIYGAGVGSVTSLAVPEPSSLALFFTLMGGWFLRRPARRAVR